MLRAVDALRKRVAPSVGGTLGYYSPVDPSDDEEDDTDRESGFEFELGSVGDELLGEGRRRRRPRREGEGWGAGVRVGVGAGAGAGAGSGELSPQYTPLYSNMKVLRRKRLDASMGYYRAGPCTKFAFLTSLWGVTFLSWLGFTLAGGSPYVIPEESPESKLALSHSVFGAAAMYLVCACVTGCSWYKSSYGTRPLPTVGDATTSLQ